MKIRLLIIFLFPMVFILNSCSKPRDHYQGYVEGENIYLASPFGGTLVKLLVNRGQHVKKGELLFQLDPMPQMLAVEQAKATLMQAKKILQDLINPRRSEEITAIAAQIGQAQAQIELASIRVKRNQALYAKHVLDKDTLDASLERYNELFQLKNQYEANLSLAKKGARVEQVNAQKYAVQALQQKLNEAQWDLAQKNGYAPIEGVIFDTYYKQGELVPASRPVLTLLSSDYMRIDFFVPLDVVDRLRLGQSITFTSESEAHAYHATITYISRQAEYVPPLVYSRENSKKLVFRVKAKTTSPEHIKSGQPVIVYLAGNSHGS